MIHYSLRTLFFAVSVLSARFLWGQDRPALQEPPARKYEVGFTAGIWNLYSGASFSADEWKKLLPSDAENGYDDPPFTQSYVSQSVNVHAAVKFPELHSGLRNITPLFTFGFGYAEGLYSGSGRVDISSFRVDSLSSGSGNTVYYIDSVTYEGRFRQLNANRLSVVAGFLLQKNRDHRFSYTTGIRLSAGMSSENSVRTGRYKSYEYHMIPADETAGGPYQGYAYYAPGGTQETDGSRSVLKNNAYFGAAIPLAIDMRLGMKDNFFGRTTLGLEASAGVLCTKMAGIPIKSMTVFSGGIGIKYRI